LYFETTETVLKNTAVKPLYFETPETSAREYSWKTIVCSVRTMETSETTAGGGCPSVPEIVGVGDGGVVT
jgi:hypothetical protein